MVFDMARKCGGSNVLKVARRLGTRHEAVIFLNIYMYIYTLYIQFLIKKYIYTIY